METYKETDTKNEQTENHPTSQRRCEINGKHFLINRHFEGNTDLNTLMAEIAISRANREMGI